MSGLQARVLEPGQHRAAIDHRRVGKNGEERRDAGDPDEREACGGDRDQQDDNTLTLLRSVQQPPNLPREIERRAGRLTSAHDDTTLAAAGARRSMSPAYAAASFRPTAALDKCASK